MGDTMIPMTSFKTDRGWFGKLRRRAAAWVLTIAALAVATISIAGAPAWPVLLGAVAVAATVVNTIAARLHTDKLTCLNCSEDLTNQAAGTYGVICPGCGSINQPYITDPAERGEKLASSPSDDAKA